MKLPDACENPAQSTAEHGDWLIEAVPCRAGDRFQMSFESSEPRWRQGIWLAVDGLIEVGGVEAAQMTLRQDTSPADVAAGVVATSGGSMRVHNMWDSGRGYGRESQAATSGMVRDELQDGYRYRCSDINPPPSCRVLALQLSRLVGTS